MSLAAGAPEAEVEFVSLPPDGEGDADAAAFADVFRAFQRSGGAGEPAAPAGEGDAEGALAAAAAAAEDDEEQDAEAVSKKKLKLLRRMKVAELKMHCKRPDVVEMWDVTAADPLLLVHLKSYRNTVPVPRHWSQKRKFLQGKRGVDKPPWELPDFLAATGIGKVREAYGAKQDDKSLKGKAHERMTPKMGKIDIDYQLLHDAFFKHQTKPRLSPMGELYFEGKEFEVQLGTRKPGVLSPELQAALAMPPGAPPPWLINMQRYGPPPSYPALRIAGLTAPIPPGCMFGYHPGGWGKPPVDEFGAPLYGDVFGVAAANQPAAATVLDGAVDKTRRWGDLEAALEESESESEAEPSEPGEAEEGEEAAPQRPSEEELALGIASTVSSLPSGVETPADLDLRKGGGGGGGGGAAPRPLYSVLEQREAHVGAGSLMGASHTYVVPPAGAGAAGEKSSTASRRAAAAAGVGALGDAGVALSLAPEDLEAGLDDAALTKRFEAAQAGALSAARGEDFSDMVAEQASKAKRKAEDKKGKKGDDAKRFKF